MRINSEQEMMEYGGRLARELLELKGKRMTGDLAVLVELVGDVGAGKTTLVRGLAEGLGVKEPVTSPSFTISKSYALPGGGRLVHYDFYRLKDPGLMIEDLQDVLDDRDNIVVVEWGESVADFLPEGRRIIRIEYNEAGGRDLTLLSSESGD